MQIRAKARRMKAEKGLDLLIVDYLQLIAGPSKSENRTQEVGLHFAQPQEYCQGIKGSRHRAFPVEPRARAAHRAGQRPQLSDLRESGSIEQDADVVIFIFGKRSTLRRGKSRRRV